MCAVRSATEAFDDRDAQVYGISVDLPFAQNVWIQQESFTFPMLSDWDHEVIRAYDVVLDDMYGTIEVAQRSVFVLDAAGVVRYRWVREGDNPDFEAFVADVRDVVGEVVRADGSR
jgi:peroxiredoxin